MKCKYCNSENFILEKRSKDDKHILDAQQVALICGDCGKYIKWCPKDERKFYWLNTNKKIETINKIEEFDKLMAEYNCQDVYELVKAMQHQLAEKDKEIEELKKYRKGAYEKYVSKCAYLQQQIKDTRKQVCDEIRNIATDFFVATINESCQLLKRTDTYISSNDLFRILEEVEKGEE